MNACVILNGNGYENLSEIKINIRFIPPKTEHINQSKQWFALFVYNDCLK